MFPRVVTCFKCELSLLIGLSVATPKMTITIKTASFFHSAHYQNRGHTHTQDTMCSLENLPSCVLFRHAPTVQTVPIIKPSHFISFRDDSTNEDDQAPMDTLEEKNAERKSSFSHSRRQRRRHRRFKLFMALAFTFGFFLEENVFFSMLST